MPNKTLPQDQGTSPAPVPTTPAAVPPQPATPPAPPPPVATKPATPPTPLAGPTTEQTKNIDFSTPPPLSTDKTETPMVDEVISSSTVTKDHKDTDKDKDKKAGSSSEGGSINAVLTVILVVLLLGVIGAILWLLKPWEPGFSLSNIGTVFSDLF